VTLSTAGFTHSGWRLASPASMVSNSRRRRDGTVFKIDATGRLTTLHHFNGTDGATSTAALIQASDGNFYGATFDGGASGLGNLFQITPAGSLRSLYSFTGGAGGAMPFSALAQATDRNFYGTTQQAGPSGLGVA
jgi:uncharacterized repeat protein (TIGR03803 family)